MERQAICGRCSQQSLPATIPLLPLISAGWGSPPALPEDTTRRHRVRISPACSTHSGFERADLVTHDIGNMVGYAFAAQYPGRVIRFALMDAPLPGNRAVGGNTQEPAIVAFPLGGPDMERLVAGRERIYLDRFWNEFSADPKSFGEASREHYAKL